jgi:hypothetical protein
MSARPPLWLSDQALNLVTGVVDLSRSCAGGRLKRTGLHETVRVDDRDRSACQPQRQALAAWRHVPALDRRRDARRRAPVSQESSATPTWPSSPSSSSDNSRPDTPPITVTPPSRSRRRRSPLHPREIVRSRDRRREVPRRAGRPRRRATMVEHPFIYEINTWVWLGELRARLGTRVGLDGVPARSGIRSRRSGSTRSG